jgi:membrane associated rhomboid family serine protease
MPVTPLYDHNTLRFIPYQLVTFGLIGVNVLVFLWQQSLTEPALMEVYAGAGLIPAALFEGARLPDGITQLPPSLTLLTCAFLHGDWLHLAGNMLFLWVFGDNVEDAMGHVKYLAFYVIGAVAASLGHAVMQPGSEIPLIGASGATSALVGAYLVLYPRAKMWALLFMRVPIQVPAFIVLGLWAAVQVFFILSPAGGEGVAWDAHIAGALAGAALIPLFKRRGVPLLGP